MHERVSIAVTVTVPDEDILTLVDCASFGIAYWVERGEVSLGKRFYQVWPDAEARLDPSVPRFRKLKFGWIAKRLVQLGTNPAALGFSTRSAVAGYAAEYVRGRIAGDDDAAVIIDSDLADAVIQLAFFDGKVVFG